MNLYLISQDENRNYDTYDSAIVCAESEQEARNIHPEEGEWGNNYLTWCFSPDKVKVQLIGVAHASIQKGIVLASFNAG